MWQTGLALPEPAKHASGSASPSDFHMHGSYGPCSNTGHRDQHRSHLQKHHVQRWPYGAPCHHGTKWKHSPRKKCDFLIFKNLTMSD